MVLELFLKVNQDQSLNNYSGKAIQRVILELNMDEAIDFSNRLQAIEKEIQALYN